MDSLTPDGSSILPPASPSDGGAGGTDTTRPLEGYFRSFGFTEARQLRRLTDSVRSGAGPGADVVAAAERRVAAWFGAALGADVTPEAARAAFVLAGGARRWPEAFLAEPVPAALAAALRRALPCPVPEPLPTAMLDQPLERPSLAGLLRGRPLGTPRRA
jgi:hypothetical protein